MLSDPKIFSNYPQKSNYNFRIITRLDIGKIYEKKLSIFSKKRYFMYVIYDHQPILQPLLTFLL